MNVDKIIFRAFFTTLAAVAVLFVFMITALVCVYPQTMMELTYDLGMEKSSLWFAEVSFDRSHDVYYIAYATEVAIGREDYAKIDSCGEKFLAHESFTEYCDERNTDSDADVTYESYVFGQVCMAKYRCGDAEGAVERAFELTGNAFPKNNAVVAVLLTALQNGDTQTAILVRQKLQALKTELSEGDIAYLDSILALTENL